MLWFFYNVLFAIGYTLMLPHFFLRMWKRGGYRTGFLQRIGIYNKEILQQIKERERVWIHAVSVGEIFVALKFINIFRKINPDMAFILTTTTSTGHRIAEKNINCNDLLLYFPTDFPFIINKVLNILNPTGLILTECELWPNLIHLAGKKDIPIILINGRISKSSYIGYRKLKVFFKKVINDLNLIFVQSSIDKKRLISLGADTDKIKVSGTAKYDVAEYNPIGEQVARNLLKNIGVNSDTLTILGGSTWSGEEKILLNIYRQLKSSFPGLKLILVPRHSERCAEVEADIQKVNLKYIKRSDISTDGINKDIDAIDVLLVNTTGELKNFYTCASVIFVGKSLTSHGGQNIIEPALFAKPIIVGPYMENFPIVVNDFITQNALIQVQNENALKQTLETLLKDESLRKEYGKRAQDFVLKKKGVIEDCVGQISKILFKYRLHH